MTAGKSEGCSPDDGLVSVDQTGWVEEGAGEEEAHSVVFSCTGCSFFGAAVSIYGTML